MKRTYEEGLEAGAKTAQASLAAADTEIAHLRKQVADDEELRLAELRVIAEAMRLGGPPHFHKDKAHWDATDQPCDECIEWWRVFNTVHAAVGKGGG
jgi:hypothetical protein